MCRLILDKNKSNVNYVCSHSTFIVTYTLLIIHIDALLLQALFFSFLRGPDKERNISIASSLTWEGLKMHVIPGKVLLYQ